MLPAEIPVGHVNQRFGGATRQCDRTGDLAGALMRVRLHRFDLDVNRQRVRIGHRVVGAAGGYVDVLPPEPQIFLKPPSSVIGPGSVGDSVVANSIYSNIGMPGSGLGIDVTPVGVNNPPPSPINPPSGSVSVK